MEISKIDKFESHSNNLFDQMMFTANLFCCEQFGDNLLKKCLLFDVAPKEKYRVFQSSKRIESVSRNNLKSIW